MDKETENRLMELLHVMFGMTKERIRERDFSPFGLWLAVDGELAWQGAEGSHSVEELMTLFKGVASRAEAFVIVTLVPTGRAYGECIFLSVLEHCHGRCTFSAAIVHDEPGDDLHWENEVSVPTTPELFVSHH